MRAALADTGSTLDGVSWQILGVLVLVALVAAAFGPPGVRALRLRHARGRTICALCDVPLGADRERWWGLCDRHHAALKEAVRRYGS